MTKLTDPTNDLASVYTADDSTTGADVNLKETPPDTIGVYDRPERSTSPLLIALIVIALLVIGYFAIQYFFVQ